MKIQKKFVKLSIRFPKFQFLNKNGQFLESKKILSENLNENLELFRKNHKYILIFLAPEEKDKVIEK